VGVRSDDNINGDGSGRVSTFEFDESIGEWVPFGDDLLGPTASAFGLSVAFDKSGSQLLVGAPESDRNGGSSGEAFLYNLVGV